MLEEGYKQFASIIIFLIIFFCNVMHQNSPDSKTFKGVESKGKDMLEVVIFSHKLEKKH